jgi:hypothetical protein
LKTIADYNSADLKVFIANKRALGTLSGEPGEIAAEMAKARMRLKNAWPANR